MKILFYNHTGQVSGAERVLMMILNGLDREVYQPVVVCPPASRMMEVATSAGVETRELRQLEARFTWRLDRVLKYLTSFAQVIQCARNVVKQERPDLVHANSIRAGVVMAAATIGIDVPVVWHAHDILPRHPLSTFVRLLALATSRNQILAVSHAVASAFRGILLRPFRERVAINVIHNSVNLDLFRPDDSARNESRTRLNLSNDQPVAAIVGQLTLRKGQLELIHAFASVAQTLPDAVLLIVGEAVFSHDQGYARQLRDTVSALALNDRVRFLGPRDDIPRLLQAVDVLVVNSHQEPFALTVLEGLASGLAVLATSVGGTPEMIQHDRNGWLVPARHIEQLSDSLMALLNDGPLRARLGAAARQDACTRYSIKRFLTQVNSLYRGASLPAKVTSHELSPSSNLTSIQTEKRTPLPLS